MAFIENDFRGVSLKMKDVFVSTPKEIATPSEVDGLDDYSEMALRIIGCESIQDAGKMLKLPQVAIACAQVLYHRFYFSKSFVRHNWEHYAMACVFLSAKIEECCRRLRDVVNVFVHIRQLREQKVVKSLSIPEYAELKPYIIKAERRVLKELGFCVHGKHPHKLICIYLHILDQEKNKDLVQLSWNYMNDSLRTTVFCRHQPEIIACACIYLASVHLQFPFGHNWFEIFGANEQEIQAISLDILRLYSINNLNVVALEAKVADLKKIQIEVRNKKIAQDKKEEMMATENVCLESRRARRCEESSNGNNTHNGKREGEVRGKENVDRKRDHHRKSHKGEGNDESRVTRKSVSPRGRSRSVVRRSRERRGSGKRSDEEDKNGGGASRITKSSTSKEHRHKHASSGSPDKRAQKQYRKRHHPSLSPHPSSVPASVSQTHKHKTANRKQPQNGKVSRGH